MAYKAPLNMRLLLIIDSIPEPSDLANKRHVRWNAVRLIARAVGSVDCISIQAIDDEQRRTVEERLGVKVHGIGQPHRDQARASARKERRKNAASGREKSSKFRSTRLAKSLRRRSRRLNTTLRTINFWRTQRKLLEWDQYEAVFVATWSNPYPLYLAAALGRSSNPRVIFWEHRTAYTREWTFRNYLRPIWRAALASSDRVLALTHPHAAAIERRFPKISSSVGVLPNPIEDSFFDGPSPHDRESLLETYPQLRRSPGSGSESQYIFGGWATWSRPMKRLDLLLSAAQRLKADGCQFHLLIAGKLPADIHQQISLRNLEETTIAVGWLSRPQVKAFAQSVDCCVITSDHETFGNPALEALAVGTPVITTASGGPEDIVSRSGTGWVVPKDDAVALARAMQAACTRSRDFDRTSIIESTKQQWGEESFVLRVQQELDPLSDGP